MMMTMASGVLEAAFTGGGASQAPTVAKRFTSKGRLTVVQKGDNPINIKSIVYKLLCEVRDHDPSAIFKDTEGQVIELTSFHDNVWDVSSDPPATEVKLTFDLEIQGFYKHIGVESG